MRTLKIYLKQKKSRILVPLLALILSMFSCTEDILEEIPMSNPNDKSTLTSKAGFEAYLIGLVRNAREEYTENDTKFFLTNFAKTDIGEEAGAEYSGNRNWVTYLTPLTDEVLLNWNWAYKEMIPQANTVITYASLPETEEIWADEAEKNAIIAEARFFRGYTYNFLANLFGGVPIVEVVETSPKFDYVRNTREEVLEFAKEDLEFASQWLPETVDQEGRIVKAAADHLLSEVYISLGEYDNAIASASRVIDSDLYQLMTERFGNYSGEPGDVYSDLFKEGNYNRSSGNLESIYVWQIEEYTDGGGGTRDGNAVIRNMGPFLDKIESPDGMSNVVTDELGRGVGRIRGTDYSIYDIWKGDETEMRNSEYNYRRVFYYNNPDSEYNGLEIENPRTGAGAEEDTLRRLYPYPRKIEGFPWEDNNRSGRITNDVYVYRLAETYLLRAEAYFRNGELQDAADDINVVRERAGASSIVAGDVSQDYILDERARELMYEEPRRRTLTRMGVLVERVREHGLLEISRSTVQDYHGLWPIPQKVIDANFGAELEQNPGYN